MSQEVKVWDHWNTEKSDEIDPWDTWEKVKEKKGFPGGLIAFLKTNTDAEGCGFPHPTQVQAYAWPVLQGGQDLVGIAKTGSGKTLAFLLPGFVKLRKLKKQGAVDSAKGPILLCLTPTRELCYQIFADTEKFGKPVQITAACAYGGEPKKNQEWNIKQGPDCLIATPGRLNDFVTNGVVDLDQVRYAVLDEADRMLDMGFEPQIRQILDKVSRDRQTAMFTATWPKGCKDIAATYIWQPMQVQIGSDDITTNVNIEQHIEVCADENAKKAALKTILGYLGYDASCLVFCNSKKKCKDLTWELNNEKVAECIEMHGDLDQSGRDDAMTKFRKGEAKVMIATDVASRGLDIRSIAIVVNYDAPQDAQHYVHRIGRTGRANDKGDAYTFLLPWGEEKKAKDIIEIMEKAGVDIPQNLQDIADGKSPDGDSGGGDSKWGGGDDEWWKKDDEKKDEWWKKEEDNKDEWWKKDEKKEDEWWKKDDKKEDKWWEKDQKEDDWNTEDNSKPEDKYWWEKDDGDAKPEAGSLKRKNQDPAGASPSKRGRRDTDQIQQLIANGEAIKLTVLELREFLKGRGLDSSGDKSELIDKAEVAVSQDELDAQEEFDAAEDDTAGGGIYEAEMEDQPEEFNEFDEVQDADVGEEETFAEEEYEDT